ncbi:MAG: hypothetical protein AUK44_09485 [Porphyromonadaceae bacterium CG2_30_38_12]|nr:MAG: hypothetical protein AUK44_09485 [Porphyromonadaceae bacterium CG2_30_38_12]
MDIQTLNSIKSKFVARQVADELVIVPLSGNVAQMNELFTLNETAKIIWENIGENQTIATLKNLLTETFDVDDATAEQDILKFLEQMDVLQKYLN